MDLLEEALAWHRLGYAPVPVAVDGSKRPAVLWECFIDDPPTEVEIRGFYERVDTDGLGLLCGHTSGNLEMLEVEGRAIALVDELAGLFKDNDLADLWERLQRGYVEQTPSFGIHWYYRVDGPARPNTKLARDEQRQVLIETRGEGGFTVVAPSHGRSHPTGRPWTLLRGSRESVPTISIDERDALYAIAALLDHAPAQPEWESHAATSSPQGSTSTLRPGDDYNHRASWDDILVGWTRSKKLGQGYGWTRPGKKAGLGISATTGTSRDGEDRLFVFSTSTDFETERPYSKFAAYTLLEHAGDFSAAAKALSASGYGTPSQPAPVLTISGQPPAPRPRLEVIQGGAQVDGTTALKPAAARTLAHSELAHSRLLVEHYGDIIRFCPDRGLWLAWNGRVWRWQPRAGGIVREHAKILADALPDVEGSPRTHKKRCSSSAGIAACLSLSQTDARVTVAIDELDADPWALNTPGGIVDLRTGQLRPAMPADLCTRSTRWAPDPSADQGRWQAFLAETFDDLDVITYLQRLVGYSAIGLVGPHILPFGYGSGGNGKGVFLESLTSVLGDYATTAPVGFLMARNYSAHETEIARLAGARMVLCSEVNEGDRFDEAKVKQLTGGDTLTARFMKQDHFTFTPTHQLWLMGNHKPEVRSGGKAFFRRLRLIGFNHEVPDNKVIDDLQGILAKEHGPALMQWIVAGAAAYAAGGLAEPASVTKATDEYAHDSDSVSCFVDDRCLRVAENHSTPVGEVRSAYERYCLNEGLTAVTPKSLGLALERLGLPSKKRHQGTRHYLGLMLIDNQTEEPGEREEEQWWRK